MIATENKEPNVSLETWTPKKAQEALRHNTKNRRLQSKVVERFANEMRLGEWRANGESIKFDASGRFIDGQHRLNAIVKSGLTLDLVTVRNLPAEDSTFATIDVGTKRTTGAIIGMTGVKSGSAIASIIRFYKQVNAASWHHYTPTTQQILSAYQNESDKWNEITTRAWAVRNIIRKPPYGAFAYLAMSRSIDSFNLFHESLKTGAGLEFDSPILALRNYLLNGNARRRSNNEAVRLCEFNACVNGWNHWRSGNKRQSIKANETKPNLDLI